MAKSEPTQLLANLDTARHLASTGAIESIAVTWGGKGWVMIINSAKARHVIKTDRGDIRFFKTIDTAARFAKSFFQNDIWVNIKDWTPQQQNLSV